MKKGIIYCATTIVPGLIKIGKTKSKRSFSTRMYNLEHDGYCNITGLKRAYAIFVDDYENVETSIQNKYKDKRVGKTELFAMDINDAIKILSDLSGEQFYPNIKEESQKEVNIEAKNNIGILNIPDDEYYLNSKGLKATIRIEGDKVTLLKGSNITNTPTPNFFSQANQKPVREWKEIMETKKVEKGKLTENYICSSISCASSIVLASSSDGWEDWKTKDGKPLKTFKKGNS